MSIILLFYYCQEEIFYYKNRNIFHIEHHRKAVEYFPEGKFFLCIKNSTSFTPREIIDDFTTYVYNSFLLNNNSLVHHNIHFEKYQFFMSLLL